MKIFISSTYEDLRPYRAAVRDTILRLRQHPVGMEDFGSQPNEWSKAALEEIDGCAAFVGIYARRYGSIPPGDDTSITEQEFDKARALDIPCFCYCLDPARKWPPKYVDSGKRKQRLKKFLRKINKLLRSNFTTPNDLAKKVSADLGRWLAQAGPAESRAAPQPIVQTSDQTAGFNVGGSITGGEVIGRDKIVAEEVVQGDKITQIIQQSAAPPPLAALHTLRAPDQFFTGREDEILQLKQMLHTGGPVAITGIRGMGGIGKTELALVVANDLRADYPDAQILIEMRGTSDAPRTPADALAEIIRAFVGLDAELPEDLSQLAALYRDRLNDKRALIVLDDLADEAQIPHFQPPSGTALLITSREALPIPSLPLEELPPEDARMLLTRMVARVPPIIADDICHLCSYLPLAIHAAGGLLSVTNDLSPEQFASDLREEQHRLAKIGKVSVPIGVEASFTLSYCRLDAESAKVFRQLAVFPAPFDAAAETYVAQDPDHTRLTDLVRRSIVQYDPTAQGYRLHDLARIFADARLTPVERYKAQLRHANHYLRVASAANDLHRKGGEGAMSGLALFDAALPHLRTGQSWAAANEPNDTDAAHICKDYPLAAPYFLDLRLHPNERIRWLQSALSAARHLGDRKAECAQLGDIGIAYTHLGEVRKGIEYSEQALTIAHDLNERQAESANLGNLGNAYWKLGELGKAIEYNEKALAIAREIGDREGEGACFTGLGLAYADLGVPRKAIENHERALAIARESGDRLQENRVLNNLGLAYWRLGEVGKAIEYYEQSLPILREIGDRGGEASALGNLGSAFLQLGELHKAIEYYEQGFAIDREIGDRFAERTCISNLAIAYRRLGDARKAIDYHEQALAIAREIGNRRGEGQDLCNRGLAYADLGEVRKAIEDYEQALGIAREIGDRQGEGADLRNLGNAYFSLGDLHKAIESYGQALAIAREMGDRQEERNQLGNLSHAQLQLGEVCKAIEVYEQALTIDIEIGNRQDVGNVLSTLGVAYASLGEGSRAIGYHERALAIASEIGDRRGAGVALGNLGSTYYMLGEFRKAIEYHEQALAIVREISDRQGEGIRLLNLSLAYEKVDDLPAAISHAESVLKIREVVESPIGVDARRQLERLRQKQRSP